MGTGWTKSMVKRASWKDSASSSMARAISADGGPPCWCSGPQGPRVRTEGMKRAPSCSKKAEGSVIRGSASPTWETHTATGEPDQAGCPSTCLAKTISPFFASATIASPSLKVPSSSLRASGVHGIVAFLSQEVHRGRRQGEGDPLVGQAFHEVRDLDRHDAGDLLAAEGLEHHDLVDAVQELRPQ